MLDLRTGAFLKRPFAGLPIPIGTAILTIALAPLFWGTVALLMAVIT